MVLLQQHVVPKSPSILLLPSSSCGCWIGEDEWGIQFFHEPSPPFSSGCIQDISISPYGEQKQFRLFPGKHKTTRGVGC